VKHPKFAVVYGTSDEIFCRQNPLNKASTRSGTTFHSLLVFYTGLHRLIKTELSERTHSFMQRASVKTYHFKIASHNSDATVHICSE
jgi:hypothetical protein